MNQIIIDCGLNQDRAAILENNDLVELYIEEDKNKRILGNIYKGRVVNVLQGMQAAFVDIGLEKNAFLYVKDAIPKDMLLNKDVDLKDISIRDVVKSGQELVVQVIKEPIGTKGARITTHITLPGRYLVLMPYTDYIGISRRIEDKEERDRLKKLADEIKPDDMGIILRTAANGVELNDLKEDLKFLVKIFTKIDRDKNLGFAPRVIYKDMDLVHRTVRDLFTDGIHKLIINDKEKYDSIVDLVELISPHLKSRVEYFDSSYDVFSYFGIDSMIKKALERKVWLKSGGYIVIDNTEALTSIDVNTGKYVGSIDLEDTVFKTNIEAAKEIAKQLRLRNIGGIIIIDFIDMNEEEDVKAVLECLEKELKKDRTKTTVLGITKLGLVEMTRKKARSRLSSKIQAKCPHCDGTGKVYSEHYIIKSIEKEVKRIKVHTNAEAVIFEINKFHYDKIVNNNKSYIDQLEEKYGIKVFLTSSIDIDINDLKVKSMGKLEYIKNIL
ncbi:Rne/Rng family ribonuclease [Caldisalinibacter kiritimatiensis]|uniref:Ribonuclease G n=1 Tax=Caldisalinibacter kiritimatiensis TaxID=1304284 RepID=R1CM83_9FIRM|nr:Rne/Rng family ribonuclease [Caldisalinibacter kiritimatiensis]EOC99815.1 Cytoplasmic axial filament protein CafA and Ribonuclease G [Caldisalinibacter kiritimatiensis]